MGCGEKRKEGNWRTIWFLKLQQMTFWSSRHLAVGDGGRPPGAMARRSQKIKMDYGDHQLGN
jgi:hypothetical protein